MDQHYIIQVFQWLYRCVSWSKKSILTACSEALQVKCTEEVNCDKWTVSSGSAFDSSKCTCSYSKHLLTVSSLTLPTAQLVIKSTCRTKDSGQHSCWVVQLEFVLGPSILQHHPPLMSLCLQWRGGNLSQLCHHKTNDCLLQGLWNRRGGA